MTQFYYCGRKFKNLETARKALLRDIFASRARAIAMGRAQTWEPPNWMITDEPSPGLGVGIVLTAEEAWATRELKGGEAERQVRLLREIEKAAYGGIDEPQNTVYQCIKASWERGFTTEPGPRLRLSLSEEARAMLEAFEDQK